jgi:acetyl-CoA acyltransferase 1
MSRSGHGLRSILQKLPTDIIILSSLRTPITRAQKGAFKDAYPEELLSAVLKATLAATPNLEPSKIDDVAIGSVLQELGGAKAGRMAQLHAGFHPRTSFHTLNRQCSSGLAAITTVANSIATGAIDIAVGGGMESMTRNYGSRAIPTVLWPELRDSHNKDARDCIIPMGMTSENVGSRYGISRADQDAFAVNSHTKASKSQRDGLFDREIVPVTTNWLDPDLSPAEQQQQQPAKTILVDQDDGIRQNASIEGMRKLKPAFKEDGSSTAGNSSQISDGAAATLLMRRSTASELGLSSRIIGKWVATRTAGCQPDEMGVGPAVAIPKLLEATGLKMDEVGIWEINEAFASQALYCIRKLGIGEERVNPKGGAIALGHPLGATGARQLATLLPELERQGQQVGVVSMCIGTGMGMAAMFVRE